MSDRRELLDFIYLDLPRLESFASQLLEGLPESRTRSDESSSEFTGEIAGGLPVLLKGSAGTKAVFSAASATVTRDHHRLVVLVLEELRNGEFLAGPEEDPEDGQFVLLEGQLQIADPKLIGRFFGSAGDLQRAVTAFEQAEAQTPSKADRRAGRGTARPKGWPAPAQTNSLHTMLEFFAADTARVRVMDDERTVAFGVVERDKFVEDLERLIARHGQAPSGEWSVLAQVNHPGRAIVKSQAAGSSVFDMVESGGAGLLEAISQLTAAGEEGLSITPLAIYRTIVSG